MEILANLPRKCYAYDVCQKFTPSETQEQKCAICEHMDEVHEQASYFYMISLYKIYLCAIIHY